MRTLFLMLVLALAAVAVAAEKVDVTGTWEITVVLDAGTGTPVATFKQDGEKITGTYKGRFGESKLEGTVKEKKIDFKVRISAEGNELTATYTGAIEDDGTLKGKVEFGEYASGTWTAKRAKEEK